MTVIHWGLLLTSILLCQAAGLLGTVFTLKSIPIWYATLRMPSFQPPSWVFGPVWTLLYTLMGVSLYRVWSLPVSVPGRSLAMDLFAVQLSLNALWTPVFFGLHKPWLAFGVIVLMWTAILATMMAFWKLDDWTAWLWMPYLAWVTFATVLNFAIARLNPEILAL